MTHILPTEEISKEIEQVLPLLKELVQNENALDEWYREYFLPNNANIIKAQVLINEGLLSEDGHSYNDESYRMKDPIDIDVKKEYFPDERETGGEEFPDYGEESENEKESSNDDIIADDTNINDLEEKNIVEETPEKEEKQIEEQLDLFTAPLDVEKPKKKIDEC